MMGTQILGFSELLRDGQTAAEPNAFEAPSCISVFFRNNRFRLEENEKCVAFTLLASSGTSKEVGGSSSICLCVSPRALQFQM